MTKVYFILILRTIDNSCWMNYEYVIANDLFTITLFIFGHFQILKDPDKNIII